MITDSTRRLLGEMWFHHVTDNGKAWVGLYSQRVDRYGTTFLPLDLPRKFVVFEQVDDGEYAVPPAVVQWEMLKSCDPRRLHVGISSAPGEWPKEFVPLRWAPARIWPGDTLRVTDLGLSVR